MQLFSKSVDALLRLLLIVTAALLFGFPMFLFWWVRTPYVTGQFVRYAQPVLFDHRHHVVDDGINCVYCHVDVDRSPTAGVPPAALCLNCHSQIWNSSPMLQLVWRSDRARRPIRWQRVNFLPDFVYFDHAIHVQKGIGCETCHGRVDRMPRVFQAAPLTMGWCLDCHRDPARYVRPRNEVTTMGYEPEEPQSVLGPSLVRAYRIRSITNCTACHR